MLKTRGISIKGMCEKLDIDLGTYNSNRSRDMLPRLDVVTRISHFLGESIDYLATGHHFVHNVDFPRWAELSDKKRHMIEIIVNTNEENSAFIGWHAMLVAYEVSEHKANGAHG
ncbi:helix-turn-helix domain-containing protein (plasmid) [Entomospira nematocerorum]|uniref:Helix-turn-helix transcriptional regulator n=1 Tax=Entomospira nematocerorum TaxID=2719987 RepID=A0A968GDG4_9SPIO|nr:helix-turn-helix domain-containing protein [Entomospira nematocera]NIZ47759.1 helix-turn-helix transcriptional regulator [Entomospira nematocera]WDI34713.1 helix-turn-helix domain-containing protein [Entomospira nematocera]